MVTQDGDLVSAIGAKRLFEEYESRTGGGSRR